MYRISIFILLIVAFIQALDAKEFYVDPRSGDDNNIGNIEAPFATLAQAKQAVRVWNTEQDSESITI